MREMLAFRRTPWPRTSWKVVRIKTANSIHHPEQHDEGMQEMKRGMEIFGSEIPNLWSASVHRIAPVFPDDLMNQTN